MPQWFVYSPQWWARYGDWTRTELRAERDKLGDDFSSARSRVVRHILKHWDDNWTTAAATTLLAAPTVQTKAKGSLARLLHYMQARDNHGHTLNLMMVGPAGCGKSTLAQLAAEKLQLPFYADSFNRDTPPWQLLGKKEPTGAPEWEYMTTAFVTAYEQGGIYLADEMDAADANTLLTLNMALAGNQMMVPERNGATVAKRHKDFHCLAACNTYGSGSRVYVGREELDEATLSRFTPLSVDYDRQYEATLLNASVHGAEIGAFRDAMRTAINKCYLRRVFSTRHLSQWIALRDAGISMQEITAEFFMPWSAIDRTAAAQYVPAARVTP